MHFTTATSILTFMGYAQAHFTLTWPNVRGFDEDTLSQYPCGGQNTPTSPWYNRTWIPVDSPFPIQLEMHHTSAKVEVLIALGDNPSGADYHTVLVPTLQEQGPMSFCISDVRLPATIDGQTVTSDMNATIMVQTSGDDDTPGSGLYNCADVTFANYTLSAAQMPKMCVNSKGVTSQPIANAESVNANGTTIGATDASSTTPTSSTSTGAAIPAATGAGLAVALGAGAAGLLAIL